MLTQIPVKVACCVRDVGSLRYVRDAISAEGGLAASVEWQDVAAEENPPVSWSAMVYDLDPVDARTGSVIRAFRERHIAAPILLYAPPTPNTGRFLERLTQLPGVFVRLQCDGHGEVTRLREDVRRVFEATPAYRLRVMIEQAVPNMPDRLRTYVRQVLAILATMDRPVRVSTATVAEQMGVAVRTLERASCKFRFPKPKELLSWVLLLYLSLLGAYENVSPCRIGRMMGLSTGTTSRLRRRLLTAAQSQAWKKDRDTAGGKFKLVFTAFVKRCGLPKSAATEVLRKELGAFSKWPTADQVDWSLAAKA